MATLELDTAIFLTLDGSLKALESLDFLSKIRFGESLSGTTSRFLEQTEGKLLSQAQNFLSNPLKPGTDARSLVQTCSSLLKEGEIKPKKNFPNSSLATGALRKNKLSLTITCGSSTGSFLFKTLEQTVIERRLSRLLAWYSANEKKLHPVIRIAIFHLGFLQVSPLERFNHFFALALTRSELLAAGYESLDYLSLGHLIYESHEDYFVALKQAERTTPGSCTTLNTWLEFMLSKLIRLNSELLEGLEQSRDVSRLPETQLKIVKLVEKKGSATRDQIAQETGINTATVKYSLSQLAAKGILKKFGGGRSTSYSSSYSSNPGPAKNRSSE